MNDRRDTNEEDRIMEYTRGGPSRYSFGDAVKEVSQKPLIIVLMVIWLAMTVLQFYMASVVSKKPRKKTIPPELRIFNKFLYLDFAKQNAPKNIKPYFKQFVLQSAAQYKLYIETMEKEKETKENTRIFEKLAYRYIMILSVSDRQDKANEFYTTHKKHITDDDVRIILKEIYHVKYRPELEKEKNNEPSDGKTGKKKDGKGGDVNPDVVKPPISLLAFTASTVTFNPVNGTETAGNPDVIVKKKRKESPSPAAAKTPKEDDKIPQAHKISPQKTEYYENLINKNLKGWFKQRTLLQLYRLTGNDKKAQEMIQQGRSKVHQLYFGFGILTFLFLAVFIVGPLAFIGMVALSVFFKKASLEESGVRIIKARPFYVLDINRALLVFFIWDLSRILLGILTGYLFKGKQMMPPSYLFVSYSVFYGVILYLVYWAIKDRETGKHIFESIGFPRSGFLEYLKQIAIGIGCYLAAVPVVALSTLVYSKIFKVTTRSQNPAFDIIDAADTPLKLLMLLMIIGVFGPIFEEILFRGLLYTSIRKYTPAWIAVPVVGLLFSLIHFDPNAVFPLFVLGTILGVVYERSGSLIPAIVTHGIWNSMTFLIFVNLIK